jgi:hypothetical protein
MKVTITIQHVHIAADTTEILAKLDRLIEAIGSTEDAQAAIDRASEKLKLHNDALAATVADHSKE